MSTRTLPATLPDSLTIDDVINAVERRMTCLDDPGFCLTCGNEADGCEPDARRYACQACGEKMVYGAEEVLIRYL